VDKIMKCVTSISFSVLFSRERLQEIKPTRCIRQGDPKLIKYRKAKLQ
jgi:hypothetical protein